MRFGSLLVFDWIGFRACEKNSWLIDDHRAVLFARIAHPHRASERVWSAKHCELSVVTAVVVRPLYSLSCIRRAIRSGELRERPCNRRQNSAQRALRAPIQWAKRQRSRLSFVMHRNEPQKLIRRGRCKQDATRFVNVFWEFSFGGCDHIEWQAWLHQQHESDYQTYLLSSIVILSIHHTNPEAIMWYQWLPSRLFASTEPE